MGKENISKPETKVGALCFSDRGEYDKDRVDLEYSMEDVEEHLKDCISYLVYASDKVIRKPLNPGKVSESLAEALDNLIGCGESDECTPHMLMLSFGELYTGLEIYDSTLNSVGGDLEQKTKFALLKSYILSATYTMESLRLKKGWIDPSLLNSQEEGEEEAEGGNGSLQYL